MAEKEIFESIITEKDYILICVILRKRLEKADKDSKLVTELQAKGTGQVFRIRELEAEICKLRGE